MAISFCSKRLILTRNTIYKTQKRNNGYIILLPEIGEDLPNKDPLLKANGFPEFNTFSVERAIAAVGKISLLFEQGIQKIEENIENKNTIDIVNDVMNPIEQLNLPLDTTWGIAKALYLGNQSLMPTKYYRSIHNRMIKAKSTKWISKPIYKAFKNASQNKDLKLTAEQHRIIDKYILEGYLNGLDVEKQGDRERFFYLNMEIIKKGAEMQKKIDVATAKFNSTITNLNIVKDFPEDFLRVIASDPKNPLQGPWKVTLEPHIVSKFLEYCPDRELRQIAWRANVERGSLVSESILKTSSNLENIRDHRMERAKILGYKSYSDMSMDTKIAGSVKNIYQTIDHLVDIARPVQQNEIEQLTNFARDRGFDSDIIRQWDIDYWIRKHRRTTLNFKDEILHEYFPLPHVLKGLFQLIENLFDIRFVDGQKTDVWHTDVNFFHVIDLNSANNEPIAHLYLDPYARGNNKMAKAQDTAWMVGIRNKSNIVLTTPLVALIFNFRPPVGDIPSLLSFKDVVRLFNEFGNALQSLLTRVDYSEVAGSSNVEWDAVNVSGHFMENWLFEPNIIRNITRHYKTNEPLSNEKIESIIKIRSHMAGYKLCKELYYARFDLELHESTDFWAKIMDRLWPNYFIIPRDRSESHITSWVEIFCGEWAATYYSSLWSKMIAADVYSAFQELSNNDTNEKKEISMRFRNTYLSLGGSVSASEVFRRFRGRDPTTEALLKNLGLNKTTNSSVE